MSVVVSDTSPLHYLILCGAESILPSLFQQVVIPPKVFQELQQPNTPPPVRQWAAGLPTWVKVQTPKSVNLSLDVDAGDLEAICLAQEIRAAAVLMDVTVPVGMQQSIADLLWLALWDCWKKRLREDWLTCQLPWPACKRPLPGWIRF